MIDWKLTNRGFKRGEFKDYNNDDCSIQVSSLATDRCLWLGLETGMHVDGRCLARMHIDQAMAHDLAQQLIYFAETGDLP